MVELGIENYSHLKQQCEMRNVTQVPTTDGNAAVQLATFPEVIGGGRGLQAEYGGVYKDVKMAFSWIIAKTRLGGNKNLIIAKNVFNGSVIRFNEYADPENNVYPFQVLEFTDKDAFRWVVVLAYENERKQATAYRWRDDSDFGDLYGTFNPSSENYKVREISLDGSMTDKNAIYEIFIDGLFYEYALNLHNWDPLRGRNAIFYDEPQESFPDFAKAVLDKMGKLPEVRATIMTDELRKIFINGESGATHEILLGAIKTYSETLYEFNTYYNFTAGLAGLLNFHSKVVRTGNRFIRESTITEKRFGPNYPDYPDYTMSWDASYSTLDKAYDLNKFISDGKQHYKYYNGVRFRVFGWPWIDETEDSNLGQVLPTETCNYLILLKNKINDFFNQYKVPTNLNFARTNENNVYDWSVSVGGFWDAWTKGGEFTAPESATLTKDSNGTLIVSCGQNKEFGIPRIDSLQGVIDKIDRILNNAIDVDSTDEWYRFAENVSNIISGYIANVSAWWGRRETPYEAVEKMADWLYAQLEDLIDDAQSRDLLDFFWDAVIARGKTAFFITGLTHAKNAADRLLGLRDAGVVNLPIEQVTKFKESIKRYFSGDDDYDLNTLECFNGIATYLANLMPLLIAKKDDHPILDIEAFSSMIVAVTDNNRFYYSDAGTFSIQSPNFYSAEYNNSIPMEVWRLANRLVMFTNNTVEFWDITNDWRDPMSPAYSSNVHSVQALSNSSVRFKDALYFLGRPVELGFFSLYSLSKNGELRQISHPQLDAWISQKIGADAGSYMAGRHNYNYDMAASVIGFRNTPILQWKIGGSALCYNVAFDSFFLSDSLYFMANGLHYQEGTGKSGSLAGFGKISALLRTPNTSFGEGRKRFKCVKMMHGNIDIDDNMADSGTGDTRSIWHRFIKVAGQPSASSREIRIRPAQGKRGIHYRVCNLGMGIDFQTEIIWNGYLGWNSIAYEME